MCTVCLWTRCQSGPLLYSFWPLTGDPLVGGQGKAIPLRVGRDEWSPCMQEGGIPLQEARDLWSPCWWPEISDPFLVARDRWSPCWWPGISDPFLVARDRWSPCWWPGISDPFLVARDKWFPCWWPGISDPLLVARDKGPNCMRGRTVDLSADWQGKVIPRMVARERWSLVGGQGRVITFQVPRDRLSLWRWPGTVYLLASGQWHDDLPVNDLLLYGKGDQGTYLQVASDMMTYQ